MAESVVRRGCGEIGKHARFRAWWAQALEGSSPFSRNPPKLSPGARLSSHLAVPVADIGITLLRLDGRIEADPMDAAVDGHHVARTVEKDRRNLLGKILLECRIRLRPGGQVERVAAVLQVAVDKDVLLHAGKVEAARMRLRRVPEGVDIGIRSIVEGGERHVEGARVQIVVDQGG